MIRRAFLNEIFLGGRTKLLLRMEKAKLTLGAVNVESKSIITASKGPFSVSNHTFCLHSRSMASLVLVDHFDGCLSPVTLSVISAAVQLGHPIETAVIGDNCASVAQAVAKVKGVSKVHVAEDPVYKGQLPESVTAILQELQAKHSYSHVLSGATSVGKNIIPRFAAKCGVSAISEIISIGSVNTFTRTIYAGNAIQTVQSDEKIICITVRPTAFEPAEVGMSAVSVESIPKAKNIKNDKSIFIKQELSKSDRPELTGAKIVISGGRGLKSGDNFKILYELADKLNAAVGASRAAVDAGFVPNDMQIGQTGKIVAPDLYVAVGISGAIQHLAGMKDSKIIVAINKDSEAPIFQVADFGLVEDLFKAVPQLTQLIKK